MSYISITKDKIGALGPQGKDEWIILTINILIVQGT